MVVRGFAKMTADEFARVAPRLGPCELVKGEVIPTSPGGFRHSKVASRVDRCLGNWADRKRTGHVLTNEAGMVVSEGPDTVRGGDVVFISYQRLPLGTAWKGFLRQPPELVVEVLGEDTSWEEVEKKIDEYHCSGVDMVWVVDPHMEAIRLCPKRGKGSVLQKGDELRGGRLLPGFRCKVADLFRP